jgi:hypothetical protein
MPTFASDDDDYSNEINKGRALQPVAPILWGSIIGSGLIRLPGQAGRVRCEPGDRLWLAALSRLWC